MASDRTNENFVDAFNGAINGANPIQVLSAFSRNGLAKVDPAGISNVEAASMAFLLNGANDIHPPEMAHDFGRIDEVLTTQTMRLAAIRTNHFDIMPKELRDGMTERDFPLKAVPCPQTLQTQVVANDRASDERLFDGKGWIDARLRELRTCIANGSNIVCLGEFDYPPVVNQDHFAKEFEEAIDAEINARDVDFPVFLVAGTRHESRKDGRNTYCSNKAKIFVNRHLDARSGIRSTELRLPIDHEKLVSAEKAGEWLEVPREPRLRYYDTRLGRIGVLVCVDAYSPNVIFSLINNRDVKSVHKLDYLLIPSYNMSQIFSFACQILSLACETTVLLVDACSLSRKKPVGSALFVGGRLFTDIMEDEVGEDGPVGKIVYGDPENPFAGPYSRVWELNLDFVRAQHIGRFPGTPFFNQVDPYLSFLKQREQQKKA